MRTRLRELELFTHSRLVLLLVVDQMVTVLFAESKSRWSKEL